MTGEPVATIQKNQRETIVIALTEFKGYQLIDCRVNAPRSDGTTGPTKAGLTMQVKLLPELIKALQAADAEARKRGLL